MIKRHYDMTKSSYFRNFYDAGTPRVDLRTGLSHYNATLAKSKGHHYINVKWHDPQMYLLFVVRWS
jgi:hypothetical protein